MALEIKQVQRGSLTKSGASASTSISTVDVSKSILLFTCSNTEIAPYKYLIAGSLDSSTSISFNSSTAPDSNCEITYEVIEFTSASDISVQHIVGSFEGDTDTQAISTIVSANAFPILSWTNAGNSFGSDDGIYVEINSNTEFTYRNFTGTADVTNVQIVESPHFNVQQIFSTNAGATGNDDFTITSVVTSSTFLVPGEYFTDTTTFKNLGFWYLNNATTITREAYNSFATVNSLVYVVECDVASKIQVHSTNFSFLTTDLSKNISIGDTVDIDKSFIMPGAAICRYFQPGNIADDDMSYGGFRFELSASLVGTYRGGTGQTGKGNFTVIEWTEAAAPVSATVIDINSFSADTFSATASTTVNLNWNILNLYETADCYLSATITDVGPITADIGNIGVYVSGCDWTPIHNDKTYIWFDAADIDSISANNGKVVQWKDKSGNNIHSSQGTLAQMPDINVNTIGGLNTITFNGATVVNMLEYNGTQLSGTNYSIFMIEQKLTNKSDNYILGGSDKGADTDLHVGYPGGDYDTLRNAHWGDDVDYIAGFLSATNATPRLWSLTCNDSENRKTYLGGDLKATHTANTLLTSYNGAKIGARYLTVDNDGYDGNIAEIIIVKYTGDLSTAEREQYEGYLAWKWGLSSELVSNHTYKNYAPYLSNLSTSLSARNWVPSDLNCALRAWYDATKSSTLYGTTGNLVSAFYDGSEYSHTLYQITPGKTPLTNSRTINNLNVLDFDGGDSIITETGTTFSACQNGNMMVFEVCEIDSTTNTVTSIVSMDASSDFQFDSSTTPAYNPRINTTVATNLEFSGGPYPGPSIYEVKFDYDNNTITGYIDGFSKGNVNDYDSLMDTNLNLKIFTNRADSVYIDGGFGELVVVCTADDNMRYLVEGYLAHKWGLESALPSDHIYKSNPPTICPKTYRLTLQNCDDNISWAVIINFIVEGGDIPIVSEEIIYFDTFERAINFMQNYGMQH